MNRGMNRGKRYLLTGAIILGVSATLLTGCSSRQERLEKEEAYRKIGINAMEEGDYAGAQEAFNNALNQAKGIGANEVDICYYKAAAQFASGSLNAAIETYDALIEYDRKNADAYFLRGCVYLKSNESKKAREDFESALKYSKDDEIYLEIYNSLSGAGYEAEAKTYLDEALEKKAGRQAKNYTVKGRIYLLLDKYEEAVEQLTTAIEKGDMEANLYLAKAYEAQGETEKANACIDAYIEKNAESSVAYNQYGCKQMREGNYEEAVDYFRQGLELEEVTNERELRSNLIVAYEYSGDFESAKTEMEAYIADYPTDEAALREYQFLGKNNNEVAE